MKVSQKLLLMLCSLATVSRARIPESIEISGNDPHNTKMLDWISNIFRPKTTTTPKPAEDCPYCECGIPYKTRRIVGGYETEKNEFVWMALLLYRNRFYCGGSSINDLFVLTAAHCAVSFRKELITVRFLEHDRSSANETNTIDRKVVEIMSHPSYNSMNYDNDIALLKLDQRINFSNALKKPRHINMRNGNSEGRDDNENEPEKDENGGIWPVCLPELDLSYTNYTAVVTGWGLTQEGGQTSDTLQEVYVPVLSNEDCNREYSGRITDNMLCAGVPEGGRDACQGDSRGPLHVFDNETSVYQEIGVVSWGYGCGRPRLPGVYARVNKYIEWILENTKDACYCY
ncbi:Trypsin-1 [Eumeta japonica]|uniref:Trypsin-1 n=1 Tax=Eumeta variegata TaxID=151549 RepID=A0A4C1TJC0_EUMVA|nr:Trypsin-1 [Eumeta japonica]